MHSNEACLYDWGVIMCKKKTQSSDRGLGGVHRILISEFWCLIMYKFSPIISH